MIMIFLDLLINLRKIPPPTPLIFKVKLFYPVVNIPTTTVPLPYVSPPPPPGVGGQGVEGHIKDRVEQF
jgi:hypothetical protein